MTGDHNGNQNDLSVISIADIENPVEVAFIDPQYGIWNIWVADDLLYFTTGRAFNVMDISDIDELAELGSINFAGDGASNIWIEGDRAYLSGCGNDGSMRIMNISNPANITEVGRLNENIGGGDLFKDEEFLYVCGYNRALYIVDVSNSANPVLISQYDTPGYPMGVFVSDGFAYVADRYENGLQILDVTDPENPAESGQIDTPGNANDVAVIGDYAFVADVEGDLQVIDVSDPEEPEAVTAFGSGKVWDVWLEGELAYIAAGENGIYIADISDPDEPDIIGHYVYEGSLKSICIEGEYAYACMNGRCLVIIDVSNPRHPRNAGSILFNSVLDVRVSGQYAYVVGSGLNVIDVSDPRNPEAVATFNVNSTIFGIEIVDDVAYLAAHSVGLVTVDISDLENPEEIGRSRRANFMLMDVAISGEFAYMVDWNYDIAVYSISDPANPLRISHCYLDADVTGVAVSGEHVFATCNNLGLKVLDVSNPDDPHVVEFYDTPGHAHNIQMLGYYAFVADGTNLGIYNCAPAMDINIPPEWTVAPPDTIICDEEDSLVFSVSAYDPNDDEVEIEMVWDDMPDSASFVDSGDCSVIFRWQTTDGDASVYDLTTIISDGELSDTLPTVIIVRETNSVALKPPITEEFYLHAAYPNPFNSTTMISYKLPTPGNVSLRLYNTNGQQVADIFYGFRKAGSYSTLLTASGIVSGVYLIRLEASDQVQLQIIILIK